MKIGIVGLPNAGKTTIFNALCNAHAKVEKYPFTTIEPNVGTVFVPDSRLKCIANIYKPKRVVNTTINFLDIAGLVKGASCGEGLGNQFLGHIREVDLIMHIVRFFNDPEIPHNYVSIDPARDIEIINTELMLADLEIVEKNIKSKKNDFLVKAESALNNGRMLKDAGLNEEEMNLAKQYGLLTYKPVIYVANVDEQNMNKEIQPVVSQDKDISRDSAEPVKICGRWESELLDLDENTREEFMKDMSVTELGLHRLIKAGYKTLGLVTFFTTESSEVKAWTVTGGAKAPEAAGRIHTDMEKGFIKAEVIPYSVLIKWKDPQKAKEHGEVKFEGREYIVEDGDIIKFYFNL